MSAAAAGGASTRGATDSRGAATSRSLSKERRMFVSARSRKLSLLEEIHVANEWEKPQHPRWSGGLIAAAGESHLSLAGSTPSRHHPRDRRRRWTPGLAAALILSRSRYDPSNPISFHRDHLVPGAPALHARIWKCCRRLLLPPLASARFGASRWQMH